MLAALDAPRQITPFSSRPGGLTQGDAYRVSARLAGLRTARGETVVKIGFTNRRIWPDAPNWGYVTDRTVCGLEAALLLAPFVEPKIEPEIVFGIGNAIEWVAHGFEIVRSIFPNWKFAPADTAAANAMHGALLIGPRHSFKPRATEWRRELATFGIELYRKGELADRGSGANVLDSPLSALHHLVGLLAIDRVNPALKAGEVVSTAR